MTKDGHLLNGRQSLSHQMIRVGFLVAIAAMQSPANAQVLRGGVARHTELYGAGYAPDVSCEPSFHSGECSDYNFCLEIWQNYCYERHPRGMIGHGGCGLLCRLHGLKGCGHGCENGCDNGCATGCTGSNAPSVPATTPSYAPPATPVEAPSAMPVEAPGAEAAASYERQPVEQPQVVSPELPMAPHETAPVTPPQDFPPDLDDTTPAQRDRPQLPPEPGDIPFTPPVNDLPKNELPLLPVSVASKPNTAPVPVASQPAYSWQRSSQQPPVPNAMNLDVLDTIEDSGTLRLVEELKQSGDSH